MHTGIVDFDFEVDSAALPEHLAECLRSVKADEVEVNSNRVSFRGGAFRFMVRGNVLEPFGFGI